MRAFTSPCVETDEQLLDKLEMGFDPLGGAADSPRLELLRPIECQMTIKDYTLVEGHLLQLPRGTATDDRLLLRLIRTKLADARIVLSDDIASDVVTGNSRVAYSVNGEPDSTCVLRHWEHKDDESTAVTVRSLLGMTLLGMTAGQHAPLVQDDGSIGHVTVLDVAFQPEAARRALRD